MYKPKNSYIASQALKELAREVAPIRSEQNAHPSLLVWLWRRRPQFRTPHAPQTRELPIPTAPQRFA